MVEKRSLEKCKCKQEELVARARVRAMSRDTLEGASWDVFRELGTRPKMCHGGTCPGVAPQLGSNIHSVHLVHTSPLRSPSRLHTRRRYGSQGCGGTPQHGTHRQKRNWRAPEHTMLSPTDPTPRGALRCRGGSFHKEGGRVGQTKQRELQVQNVHSFPMRKGAAVSQYEQK